MQAAHHLFVASAKAVILGHEIDPDNKIGYVVWRQCFRMSCNPNDVIANIEFLRPAMFYCDVSVKDIIQTINLKNLSVKGLLLKKKKAMMHF